MLFAMKPSRKRKRALTLLEVVIAMVLLGTLLMGVYQALHQSLKKSITAKNIQQKFLPLELFQQRLKALFICKKNLWLENHPDALGPALLIMFEPKADPEFETTNGFQGMLYLNDKKQLHFVTWATKEKVRDEVLLDNVRDFQCKFFDPQQGNWLASWSKKKTEKTPMISIQITQDPNETTPFVFFLPTPDQKITYQVATP